MIRRNCMVGAVLLAVCAAAPGADLPDELKKGCEKAVADREKACAAAGKKLVERLDAELETVKNSAKLKPQEKIDAVAVVKEEKARFEANGTIPFSPPMRADTLAYLAALKKADAVVTAAYGKAVTHVLKANDDAFAKDLEKDRKELLKPRVVALWNCSSPTYGEFKVTLYSDMTRGEGAENTWELTKDKLVLTNHDARSVWVDNCVIEPNGSRLKATTAGTSVSYGGKLAEPEKK